MVAEESKIEKERCSIAMVEPQKILFYGWMTASHLKTKTDTKKPLKTLSRAFLLHSGLDQNYASTDSSACATYIFLCLASRVARDRYKC
jgi:hypothetical protein